MSGRRKDLLRSSARMSGGIWSAWVARTACLPHSLCVPRSWSALRMATSEL